MNYKAESAESRNECIDKVMEPIEKMHKEIEELKRIKKKNSMTIAIYESVFTNHNRKGFIDWIQRSIAYRFLESRHLIRTQELERDCQKMWLSLKRINENADGHKNYYSKEISGETLSKVSDYPPKA